MGWLHHSAKVIVLEDGIAGRLTEAMHLSPYESLQQSVSCAHYSAALEAQLPLCSSCHICPNQAGKCIKKNMG